MEEKNKPKLSRYTDPTGEFSNRSLKLAEWYLKHKLLLQKIGKNFLIVWCVVTVGYSFGYWTYYLSYGYFKDQNMMQHQALEFQNYDAIKPLYSAQSLQVGNIDVYNSVSDLYDFVAKVTNPNERWIAKLTYKFTYVGGETESHTAVLWPKAELPIATFGVSAGAYPSYPHLVIEKMDWRRINPHSSTNIPLFVTEHTKFTVENFTFTPASRFSGTMNHIIKFELFNDTAYNFWDPEFYVELFDGGQTTGFIYVSLDKFKTGDKRIIDLRSWVDNLNVSDIVVWPVFDIFDKNEYMPIGE